LKGIFSAPTKLLSLLMIRMWDFAMSKNFISCGIVLSCMDVCMVPY
jgi:hypothetical protein